jgi:hypothetical protein
METLVIRSMRVDAGYIETLSPGAPAGDDTHKEHGTQKGGKPAL